MVPIVAALMKAGLGILGSAVASKGKDLIEEKLGVDIGGMLGTEQGRIELARLENEHEEALQKFAIEKKNQELKVDEMAYANTDSARKMQIAALSQEDVFSKRFVYYLATGWSLFSVVYIGFITFGTIPEANIRFADTILGFLLGTVVATILNYFLGSSKSSKDKDSALAEAIKGNNDV